MATKSLTTSATCKHCGGTIILKIDNIPVDQTAQQARSGGVSASCPKCHKSSSYSYRVKGGQIDELR